MLRTLNEVYELIKKKETNANNSYNREWHRKYPSKEMLAELKGQMMAYEDCKLLIKSSHLVDEDGRIEEAKKLVEELRQKGKSMTEIVELLNI